MAASRLESWIVWILSGSIKSRRLSVPKDELPLWVIKAIPDSGIGLRVPTLLLSSYFMNSI